MSNSELKEDACDIKWNEGGKQDCLDRGSITMSHDELIVALGESAKMIKDAGFVLVPRSWQERVFAALDKKVIVT